MRTHSTLSTYPGNMSATQPTTISSPKRTRNHSGSVSVALYKVEQALYLALENRLNGRRVAIDEEFATGAHEGEVVARQHDHDVPEDVVVVFLVVAEFRGAFRVQVEPAVGERNQ